VRKRLVIWGVVAIAAVAVLSGVLAIALGSVYDANMRHAVRVVRIACGERAAATFATIYHDRSGSFGAATEWAERCATRSSQ
jgi:hypothetical protein